MSKIHSRIDESSKNLENSALKKIFERARDEKTEYLDLSKNQFTEINIPFPLHDLKVLDLSYNNTEISTIIIPEGFDSLKYLWIYQSNLKEIEIKGAMPMLDTLHLAENKLESIALEDGFGELVTLYLEKNQLKEFPEDLLDKLPKLEFLSLRENNIENIQKEIYEEQQNVVEDVRHYLIAQKQGSIINNEAKVIWFGNGEAGKTTLSHQLRAGEFKYQEKRTHGILINNWEIDYNYLPENLKNKIDENIKIEKQENPSSKISPPEKIILNMWDFGGQEYYHATHRLFLNNNVLYLLAWEEKTNKYKEEIGIEETGIFPLEYWRENIRSNAPENIIFEIQNKDEGRAQIDFSNFRYKINFRNKNDENSIKKYEIDVEDLKIGICNSIHKLEYLGKRFPKVYDDIRKALRLEEKPFLGLEEYKQICLDNDNSKDKIMGKDVIIDEGQLRTLTNFLHDTGSIICYQYQKKFEHQSSRLKDYVFVKPDWVTKTIYKVLSEDLKQKRDDLLPGEFDEDHFVNTLPSIQPKIELEVWRDLMKSFELIFEIKKNGKKVFVAPQYLGLKCPNEEALKYARGGKNSNLSYCFTLHYPGFLPRSLFLRFVAHFGDQSGDDYLYWKKGLFFWQDGVGVYAECNYEKGEISFEIQNKDSKTAQLILDFFKEKRPQNAHISIDSELKDFVSLEKLQEKISQGNSEIESLSGNTLMVESFSFLFGEGASIPPSAMKFQKQISKEKENGMKNIRDLIAKGELQKVIKSLLEITENTDLHNDIVMQSARLNKVLKDERMGIIRSDDADRTKNQITHALLSYLPKLDLNQTNDPVTTGVEKQTEKEKSKAIKIFFSYSWGDEKEEGESREKIVDDLYESLKSDSFQVVRDKMDVGYRGLISKFMQRIGRGEAIIVVISDKYVRSPYCMYELLEIARNCKFEKEEFAKKVFPIAFEQIDFDDPDVIDNYLDYWGKQEIKWENLFQKRMNKLSTAQYDRYNRVKEINSKISELVDWIADINSLTKELLAANNFETIKMEIQKLAENVTED